METDFRNPDKLFTPASLNRVLAFFLPGKFRECLKKDPTKFKNLCFLKDNGIEIVQFLLDNSGGQLRMYGSAKELVEYITIYRNFTASHSYFEIFNVESYNTSPMIYRNLQNQEFVCKQDMLVKLQSKIFRDFLFTNHGHIKHTIMIFFKSREKLLNASYELIPNEDDVFDEISKEVATALFSLENKTKGRPKNYTVSEYVALWKTLYSSWEPQDFNTVQIMVKQAHPVIVGRGRDQLEVYFESTKTLLETLQKSLDSRPLIFKPLSYSKNSRRTIRLFEDGNHQFFMKFELSNAIQFSKTGSTAKNEVGDIDCLDTVDVESANKTYGADMEKLDIIIIPILRSKHAATPVFTHTSNYWILAVDALFQNLRRAIFLHQFFQRSEEIDLDNFKFSINSFLSIFDSESKTIQFVNTDILKLVNFEMDQVFDFDEMPAKYVRNAKKDGFTVLNLRNELIHLELDKAFPNITDYVDIAYNEVVKNKREQILRTCDLFDAIEHCQLLCIFEKYPQLKTFLHSQHGCHRVPGLVCEDCLKISIPEKLEIEKFEWNELKEKGTRVRQTDKDMLSSFHWKLVYPDSLEIHNSFSLDSTDKMTSINSLLGHKYFIFDNTELNLAKKNGKVILNSPRKTTYLRAIPTSCFGESRRVFTEEVLEFFMNVCNIKPSDARLKKYLKKWDTRSKNVHYTIDLNELEAVFDDLEADKSLITIAPDPVFQMARHQMIRKTSIPTVNVSSPLGDIIMHTSQAILHIFESIAFGTNWNIELCKKHKNCTQKFKKAICDLIEEYADMPECFVSRNVLEKKIDSLRLLCNYEIRDRSKKTEMENVIDLFFDQPVYCHIDKSEFSGKFTIVFTHGEDEAMHALWVVRYLLTMKMVDSVFGDDMSMKAQKMLHTAIQFRVPLEEWSRNFDDVDLLDMERDLKCVPFLKDTRCLDENPENRWSDSEDDESPDAKSTTSERSENPESCMKSNSSDELKKEIGLMRIKWKNFEIQKQQKEEKDREKLKVQQNEIEELKRKVAAQSKCFEENELLKERIKKIEESEQRFKETNKKLTDSKNQLALQMLEMKSEVKRQKQAFYKEKLELLKKVESELMEKKQLLIEINQKTEDFQRVQQENLEFSAQIEENNRKIESLLEKIDQNSEDSDESIDLECLICHEDMHVDMKSKMNLSKCENCTRLFHVECLSEWLKRKQVCPVCNRLFLDPPESPTVG